MAASGAARAGVEGLDCAGVGDFFIQNSKSLRFKDSKFKDSKIGYNGVYISLLVPHNVTYTGVRHNTTTVTHLAFLVIHCAYFAI